MKVDQLPAADNIALLRQGAALIERLDDAAYVADADPRFRGGPGGQFRHCIDFYLCLLRGYPAGEVDYGARERDRGIERDRSTALRRVDAIAAELGRLREADCERTLRVRAESPPASGAEWSGSTLGRELQFLVSHTVHHYALIAALLALQGVALGPGLADFGVAPSTIDYRKAAGRPSR